MACQNHDVEFVGCGSKRCGAAWGGPDHHRARGVWYDAPTFDEEFNETTGLDGSVWKTRDAGKQWQCNITSQAAVVANGYLRLSVYDDNSGNHYCGAITTAGGFEQKYGYFEAGVRYQYQPGLSCSWWLQSPTIAGIIGNPQLSGVEMDIFEHGPYATADSGDDALHWNGYTAYEGSQNHNYTNSVLTDGAFHKYGIAWTPSSYTFYIDGVAQWTQTAAQAPISNALEYLIVDTALPDNDTVIPSGGYGPQGSSSNASIDVDYIRVYPWSGAGSLVQHTLPVAKVTNNAYSDDAYVRDGSYAATNFVGSTTLTVKGDATGYNRNSYLMFDLTGIMGTVQQATLYLTPTSEGSAESATAPIINDLFLTSNSWIPSTIDWNNAPAAIGGTVSFGTNLPVQADGTFPLTFYDVTQPAKTQEGQLMSVKIGPNPNFTGSDFQMEYAAAENTTAKSQPSLVVLTTP